MQIQTPYSLQGNPAYQIIKVQKGIVGNLIYDDLGQCILRKLNEEFKGVRNIEDTTHYKPNQPIAFSNTPRALYIAELLRTDEEVMAMTQGTLKVLSPEEIVQYWEAIPNRNTTYADTDSVSLYPKEGPNEDLRRIVLNLLGKKPSQVKTPFVVSGLGVKKDTSLQNGFTFIETDFLQAREAPYLERDCKVTYDQKEQGLVIADQGVSVWTPSGQSGLRRVYQNRYEDLGARDVFLLVSNEAGRVQFLQRPQGAENLEALIA